MKYIKKIINVIAVIVNPKTTIHICKKCNNIPDCVVLAHVYMTQKCLYSDEKGDWE